MKLEVCSALERETRRFGRWEKGGFEDLSPTFLFPHHSGVILRPPGGLWPVEALVLVLGLLLAGLEDLEGAHERLVHRHHAASVVELAAVVGGREEGDQLPLG